MKSYFLIFFLQFVFISSLFSQYDINAIIPIGTFLQGDRMFFDAQVSNNSNGILDYYWEFGDTYSTTVHDNNTASHTYTSVGDYTLTLTLRDEQGNVQVSETQISIDNVPPQIMYADGTESTDYERLVIFKTIVYDPDKSHITYHIDFGDGITAEGPYLDDASHIYDDKGYYLVTVTVDDGDGGTDTRSFIVSVDEDWGASVSGGIRDTISGGSAMFYYHNEPRNICLKLITLYDDATRSLITFHEESNKGIANRTIPLTSNSTTGMNVAFSYKIIPGMYGTSKALATIWDQTTDLSLLGETLEQVSQFNPTQEGSDDFSKGDFDAIGGQLVTGPLNGDSFKGQYTVTLKERNPNSTSRSRLIGIIGSFEININSLSLEQMKIGCEGAPEDFVIMDFTPGENTKNVHPRYPCLEVEFSDAVDITSADNNNIQLGYYDNLSRFVNEPLAFEAVSESRIKIIPAAPLRQAVIYEVRIKSGDASIRSREGGTLNEDFKWNFQTLVDPSETSVRVYQSIKDKPLINGKDAMVRVILSWDKPEDVHPNSFVKSFSANVSLKNAAGGRLCPDVPIAEFKQQEYVTGEEIRMASNSVNIYGWKPSHMDGDHVIIEIEPLYMDCVPDDESRKYKITHSIRHSEKALELTCDYYFLPIHTWDHEGITDDTLLLADRIMDKVSAFSSQIFPVRKLTSHNRGIYPIHSSGFMNYSDPGADSSSVNNHNIALLDGIVKGFYLLEAINSPADIVFVFYPQIDGIGRGFTYTHAIASFFPLGDRFFQMELTDKELSKAAIEHEFGHTFGLRHEPGEWADVNAISFDNLEVHPHHNHMEGFRIYADSYDGQNKSCEEGNAESNKLVNLMYPNLANLERVDQFINGDQYDFVTGYFQEYMPNRTVMNQPDFSGISGWLADLNGNTIPLPDVNTGDKNILIQGDISNNGIATIRQITLTEWSLTGINGNGTYRLVALDKAGNPLFTDNFAPDSVAADPTIAWPLDKKYFISVIPYDTDIAKFEVVHNDQVVGSYTISAHPPVVAFSNIERGAKLKSGLNEIQWTASDPDEDPLEFVLSYSPNGFDNWQVIGRTDKTNLSIDPKYLMMGDGPTLKIEASDGYHTHAQSLSIDLETSFAIRNYGPIGDENEYNGIFIRFKNPVIKKELITGGHLILIEKGKRKPIDSYVTYDDDLNTARINTLEKLNPGTTYVVMVRKIGLIWDANAEEGYIQGTVPLADIYGNEMEKDFMWEFVKQ